MSADIPWCSVRLRDQTGTTVGTLRLAGPGRPDLAAIDWLAQVHLDARRHGHTAEITEICADLAELLDCTGLTALAD